MQRGNGDISFLQVFDIRSVVEQMTANRIQPAPIVGSTTRIDPFLDFFLDASDPHRDEFDPGWPVVFRGRKINIPQLTGTSFR